jgi:hypothetical protein
MDAIRSKHADFYDLPDDTRYNAQEASSSGSSLLHSESLGLECARLARCELRSE